jgi:chemotaxis protein MotA
MPPTITTLFDPGALAIVLAGTVFATAVRCGWHAFAAAIRAAGGLAQRGFDPDANRRALALVVTAIERDGPLRADPAMPPDRALALMLENFLRHGSLHALEATREAQSAAGEARRISAAQVFACAGELAPVFGLIGTLYGLTQLAPGGEINATATIMGAVSTAVLTSLYGALLAHLVCFPLASAIERRGADAERERAALTHWFVDQFARLSAQSQARLQERRAHLRGVA